MSVHISFSATHTSKDGHIGTVGAHLGRGQNAPNKVIAFERALEELMKSRRFVLETHHLQRCKTVITITLDGDDES